jgi:hypothetical protein
MIELLEFADAGVPLDAAAHLEFCPRCQALFEHLPEAPLSELPGPSAFPQELTLAPRIEEPTPQKPATGQLWITKALEDTSEREIVAVVGLPPGDNEYVIVAPTTTAIHEAGGSDLVIEESPLGYSHLVCLWNQGTVKRSQLEEYVGRLERSVRTDIVSVYRWLTGAGERPNPATRSGHPILSNKDGRLVFRALESERLRPLWAKTSAELGAEPEDADTESYPTLGALVQVELTGIAWDRTTLLESSGVDGEQLDALLSDKLDLTGRSDIAAVAHIVKVLHIPHPERPLERSLHRSPGGLPIAADSGERLAARSWHDVDAKQRRRDLYRDQMKIDYSDEGRRKAIAEYLREFETELDSIE